MNVLQGADGLFSEKRSVSVRNVVPGWDNVMVEGERFLVNGCA